MRNFLNLKGGLAAVISVFIFNLNLVACTSSEPYLAPGGEQDEPADAAKPAPDADEQKPDRPNVGGAPGPVGPQGPAGQNGADGEDGVDGQDGQNGADGVDGEDGQDGVDGQNGRDGVDGQDGQDGEDGADGQDGADGEDGQDGADGADGEDGADGQDGEDGQDGRDGVDGQDGRDGTDYRCGTMPMDNACPEGIGEYFICGPDLDADGDPDQGTLDVIVRNCDPVPTVFMPATQDQCPSGGVVYGPDADGDDKPDLNSRHTEVICFPEHQHDPAPVDSDGDGDPDSTDCAINNARVFNGAAEICGNGVDDDCNGADQLCPQPRDSDNDGDPDSTDCNDQSPRINRAAVDVCGNGVDEDCNGVDLLCPQPRDSDGDGFEAVDCNDQDPRVFPGAPEICGDGIDQDCNGADLLCPPPVPEDRDGDGFRAMDCNDQDPGVYPGAPERCNGVDDDCDGLTDEGLRFHFFLDRDGDGFGDANDLVPVAACQAPAGRVGRNDDCDDSRNGVHPGAAEVCGDGLDNDCSGGDLACQPPPRPLFEATVMFPGNVEPKQLNVEFSFAWAEVGWGWDFSTPWMQNSPSVSLALDGDDVDLNGVCYVRLNETVGNLGHYRWLCEGAGPTARIDPTASVRIRIGDRVWTERDPDLVTWTPDGVPGGCSMLLIVSRAGVCARP